MRLTDLWPIGWFVRKREQRKVVSGILDYAGAYRPLKLRLKLRWELRRIPNILDLYEKYQIFVPEFEDDGCFMGDDEYDEYKDEDAKCCVCGNKATFTHFIKFLDSPLIYGWLKKYVICGRRVYKRHKNELISTTDFGVGGVENLELFCSRECYASFELWNLFLPTNKTEWFLRYLLIIQWRIKKIFRCIFG